MTSPDQAQFISAVLASKAPHPAIPTSPAAVTWAPAAARQGTSIEQERRRGYFLSGLTFIADTDIDQQ